MTALTVEVPETLEAWVRQRVERGDYASAETISATTHISQALHHMVVCRSLTTKSDDRTALVLYSMGVRDRPFGGFETACPPRLP
jgi:hypothetical protein